MARLIHGNPEQEGDMIIKWLKQRLLINNKNVLSANLGATGSGKSYRDLRIAELHYKRNLNKPFPPENICFGVEQIMERLQSGELIRGEVLICEEAGVNLGSLDFQNRVVKLFNYVLQSFRSMNIAIFFNLPYLSMLTKQARMLIHITFESVSIDQKNKVNTCKPFFHQVNQQSGKVYRKYPRVKVNGNQKTIKRFDFSLPSQYLIDAYETKKNNYLINMTKDFSREINQIKKEKMGDMGILLDTGTPFQREAKRLFIEYNGDISKIAEKLEISKPAVYDRLGKGKKLANLRDYIQNLKGNKEI